MPCFSEVNAIFDLKRRMRIFAMKHISHWSKEEVSSVVIRGLVYLSIVFSGLRTQSTLKQCLLNTEILCQLFPASYAASNNKNKIQNTYNSVIPWENTGV